MEISYMDLKTVEIYSYRTDFNYMLKYRSIIERL